MANILIVEDNSDIACLYERIFAKHQNWIAADIPEAMQHLRQKCPDLLILDFHLPSGSGLEILKFLRASPRFEGLAILAITADDLLKDAASKHGVHIFLRKPFKVVELAKAADKLLNQFPPPLSPEMLAALQEYAVAYQLIHKCQPSGHWTGSQVLIDGQIRDEVWLRAESRRLRNLTVVPPSRSYLHRLIDKIRHM